jgi:DNA recombination protein RmuC
MDATYVVGALVVGILLGAGGAWLALRSRISGAVERGRSESAAERAGLVERLAARDAQITELRQQLQTTQEQGRQELQGAKAQLAQLQTAFQSEAAQRVAAEERTARIPALEAALRDIDERLAATQDEKTILTARLAELDTRLVEERKAAAEKLALLGEAEQKLGDTFKALSAAALKSNNESFLLVAKGKLEEFHRAAQGELESRQKAIGELVKPLKESLDKVTTNIQELEKARTGAYASLGEQLKRLTADQGALLSQTSNLVKALRAPTVRGRWGEIQLKRVVELAGMLEYCDFVQQETVDTDTRRLRPDLIVRLPGDKQIVVDAKAPLSAYLDALEAPDEGARLAKLREHAMQVRRHVQQLAAKAYWDQFDAAPEFVVLFLPGETFFSAALEQDPQLIEFGVKERVILATPTTLIALLRAVAYGWRQERIAESAEQISQLGRTLYERLHTFAEHLTRLGHSLGGAVDSYNRAVGSLEGRVLVAARKFKELGAAAGADIDETPVLDKTPRALTAPVESVVERCPEKLPLLEE